MDTDRGAEIRSGEIRSGNFDANDANSHEFLTPEPMIGSRQPKLGLPIITDKRSEG